MEKYGNNWSKPGVMVSNGPYILDSYDVGKEMVLKKNPFYSKPVENNEVHIYFSLDHEKTLKMYQEGFFPFIHSSPETEKIKLSKRLKVPTLQHFSMTVNAKKYPMNSRDFRQAIFQSINIREVLKQVKGENLVYADNLIPPPLRASSTSIVPSFNPTEAKKALAKAGFIKGKKAKLQILTRLVDPFPQLGNAIKDQITKNLGLNVELSELRAADYSTYAALHDYDLTIINWVGKTPEAQDFLKPYSPTTSNSRLIFDNVFFPQLLNEGMYSKDKKEAQDAFDRAQKLYIQDESVVYPLAFGQEIFYSRPEVEQIRFDHMSFPIYKSIKLKSATKKTSPTPSKQTPPTLDAKRN